MTFTTRITGIRDKEIILGKDMIKTELTFTVIMITKEGHIDIQVIDLKNIIMILPQCHIENIENIQESTLFRDTHYDDEYDHRK